jgi:hypothetical protein
MTTTILLQYNLSTSNFTPIKSLEISLPDHQNDVPQNLFINLQYPSNLNPSEPLRMFIFDYNTQKINSCKLEHFLIDNCVALSNNKYGGPNKFVIEASRLRDGPASFHIAIIIDMNGKNDIPQQVIGRFILYNI